MVEKKHLELLQFDKIKSLVQQKCHSKQAKLLCEDLFPKSNSKDILAELNQTNELKLILAAKGYFPSVEHEDIWNELNYLSLDGALLHEAQLLSVLKTTEVSNTLIRYLKSKKSGIPFLSGIAKDLEAVDFVADEIHKIIDSEAQVKNNASPELGHIRKQIAEKRRESDKRFYNYINELRKHGFLRENEESFFNGRRTLAVLVEHKSEVPGFVHSKSESGKTIFIEPGVTIGINNDVAELEIDEHREVNRILRELCALIKPYSQNLKDSFLFLTYFDFVKAKAEYAVQLNASLPEIKEGFNLHVAEAYHPLLFLQNKKAGKPTIPLTVQLNSSDRIIVISGPNAGGKTIALKTIGLLQLMLQSGLLIPVKETSSYCFFEKILIDIGDTQSIENELSTYSAKLKSMTSILNEINESTLVLMDEFGSGTDPELGSAIAETVLESLVNSKTRGIITSHFGDVKLLAEKLNGAVNASMLFNIESLEPKYILSVGEPGSSYTFEVAERIGFPKHLIERAKEKVDKDKLKLNRLLADVQNQKTKLAEQLQRAEHEEFLKKIAKEKYHTLFNNWEEKINKERERKIELARLADFGQKYLRLMEDWNKKKDKKVIIKRFIDGITAETKKQEDLRKQNKLSAFAEKKIARLKPVLKVGSKVKVLNGSEVGVIEEIKDEKVFIKFGLMKMTVGMENLVLAED
jgi:DNA mismatch repair protein MutS2